MKTLFIPVKDKTRFNKDKLHFPDLKDNIVLAYSIQFQDLAFELKEILSKKYKILNVVQVLGCSSPKLPKNTSSIILLSTGRFHATSLAYESNLPVYVLENNTFSKIDQREIDLLKAKKKSAYMQFLNSSEVGLIISTKPGQENLQKSLSLKKSIKNKKVYSFLANNIDTNEFENFNLNSWINTACPRMDLNLPIINISDLQDKI
jgi:2-(3-amino-3-carboxypropyl)histidine synthase